MSLPQRVPVWVVSTRTPPSHVIALPDNTFLNPRDWIYDLHTAYCDSLPPLNVTRPCLWQPRHDESDKFLTEERRITSSDDIDT
jgi:hypothetical protein